MPSSVRLVPGKPIKTEKGNSTWANKVSTLKEIKCCISKIDARYLVVLLHLLESYHHLVTYDSKNIKWLALSILE
jgi:hypothetical protein